MNVQQMAVTKEQAFAALREYKEHRNVYDKRDWEIERIYRQIARGKTVISAFDAIRNAGLNSEGFPKLAICRADAIRCGCRIRPDEVRFLFNDIWYRPSRDKVIDIPWPGITSPKWAGAALLPRIPPQHRPKQDELANYHLLWEADWHTIPSDPYLLRRIGADAWVVLAAWELTDVEMGVLRAHQ